jgi:acyl-CoA reductase-like NAD-dependent aldehyde dehydrogenase
MTPRKLGQCFVREVAMNTPMSIGLRVGGEVRAAADGKWAERVNPISGEVVTRAAAATLADADAAVEAAGAAFGVWSEMGPGHRRAVLYKAAELLEGKAGRVAEVVTAETGATLGWGQFNVMLAANMLREAASLTTQVAGEVIPSDKAGVLAMAIRRPAGVVLGIAPWNAPVILGVRALATPLACGNTVILKASEMCPATHSLIVETLEESGGPAGFVNLVTNDVAAAPKIVERLIEHRAVRRVNFTGSTRVGRRIGELCGLHLKPALLELGGKAPLVVLDDANVDDAVAAAVFGAYANQGQICMSTERIIVDRKIADVFVEKLAKRARALSAGDPRAGKAILGSLVSAGAAERVRELSEDAAAQGAVIVVAAEIDGSICTAAVVDHVTAKMKIYAEESFGPIAAVIRVDGDDEAVRTANDTEYGLSAAVFSQNINRAIDVAMRVNSGMCHINGPTVADEAQMPFGGTKASGYGRFGGKAGIAEFTDLRWITIATKAPHYPF